MFADCPGWGKAWVTVGGGAKRRLPRKHKQVLLHPEGAQQLHYKA